MKMLNAFGQVVIPHSRPGTNRGIDSRGPRLCFASLARSCADSTGFFNFADGTAYSYLPGSNGLAENLCAAPQRGRSFNLGVRRSLFGFTRGYTPPGDYEQIYAFPPYAGTQPAACALAGFHWNNLIWSILVQDPGIPAGSAVVTTASMNAFDISTLGAPAEPFGPTTQPFVEIQGDLTYNGPLVNCLLSLTYTIIAGGNANFFFQITQDGNQIADQTSTTFDVLDTAGLDSLISVHMILSGTTGNINLGVLSGGGRLFGDLSPA